jgi:large subunit ribosomal protein L17e
MGKTVYSRNPTVNKVARTSAKDLRVHYKNTYETANAIKGLTIPKAKQYLKDVLAHRRCVPYLKHFGGIGRTGQAAEFGKTLGRWPEKSVRVVLGLVNNLESNANAKNLKNLTIDHVAVDRAAKGRRRTYRAHGRIGPYLSSQTHVQMWATERAVDVKREGKARQVAKGKIPVGESQ